MVMTEVLHANVFFFITSIAVIVFTILLCIVLYHVLKITKAIRKIVERVEEGSEVLAEDMHHLRGYFAEGGLIAHLIRAFFGRAGAAKKKTKRRSSAKIAITDED